MHQEHHSGVGSFRSKFIRQLYTVATKWEHTMPAPLTVVRGYAINYYPGLHERGALCCVKLDPRRCVNPDRTFNVNIEPPDRDIALITIVE